MAIRPFFSMKAGAYSAPCGLYTFQETPASSRTSGMVSHDTLYTASGDELVMSTGPPAWPDGSSVPDSDISRLGCVGPSTEQW